MISLIITAAKKDTERVTVPGTVSLNSEINFILEGRGITIDECLVILWQLNTLHISQIC